MGEGCSTKLGLRKNYRAALLQHKHVFWVKNQRCTPSDLNFPTRNTNNHSQWGVSFELAVDRTAAPQHRQCLQCPMTLAQRRQRCRGQKISKSSLCRPCCAMTVLIWSSCFLYSWLFSESSYMTTLISLWVNKNILLKSSLFYFSHPHLSLLPAMETYLHVSVTPC
jgi:hypothetical protein